MGYTEVYAKKTKTRGKEEWKSLVKHTFEALQIFDQVFEWHRGLILATCKEYTLDFQLLYERLFLTVALHDLGKATREFQNYLNDGEARVSHALNSAAVFLPICRNKPLALKGKSVYPEVFAIATHHYKAFKNAFSSFEDHRSAFLERYINVEFHSFLKEEGEKRFGEGWDCPNLEIPNEPEYEAYFEILGTIKYTRDLRVGLGYRLLFLLFKGILHYSDWLSSSEKFDYQYAIANGKNQLENSIKQVLENKGKPFLGWRSFQLNAERCSQDSVIIKIPTGQGKTEAALLWGMEGEQEQKILFLLPTQVTVNKIYLRLKSYYPSTTIGLSHGNGLFFLEKENETLETDILKKEYLLHKTFISPVTVATVDQLIYSFFNWGYWTLTGLNSLNAKIIIDEIHLYDGYTLGLIVAFLKEIKKWKSKFCLMSATLPERVQQLITSKLGIKFKTISEDSFKSNCRHTISLVPEEIKNSVSAIIKDYVAGRKVLVVCNTKVTAAEIYKKVIKHKKSKVDKKEVMLYHSGFIVRDRFTKEDELEKIGQKGYKGAFIAITTQVCEVSLDLDFDALYTENAPIASLIQRLGRANRNGEKELAQVFIYKECESSRKYIYKTQREILKQTWQTLECFLDSKSSPTEGELQFMVEEVYKKLPKEFSRDFESGFTQYREVWERCTKYLFTPDANDQDLEKISSRQITYIQVDCLLQIHNQHLDFSNQSSDVVKEHLVKIPYHLVRYYRVGSIWDGRIPIVCIPYSYDTGIEFKTKNDNYEIT